MNKKKITAALVVISMLMTACGDKAEETDVISETPAAVTEAETTTEETTTEETTTTTESETTTTTEATTTEETTTTTEAATIPEDITYSVTTPDQSVYDKWKKLILNNDEYGYVNSNVDSLQIFCDENGKECIYTYVLMHKWDELFICIINENGESREYASDTYYQIEAIGMNTNAFCLDPYGYPKYLVIKDGYVQEVSVNVDSGEFSVYANGFEPVKDVYFYDINDQNFEPLYQGKCLYNEETGAFEMLSVNEDKSPKKFGIIY